jgi:hypothetical protein
MQVIRMALQYVYMHYFFIFFLLSVPGAVEFYGNLSVALFKNADFQFGAIRGNLRRQIEVQIQLKNIN